MILCTVEGDIHDIGKNIVKAMLEAGGFKVIDLGVDVPPEKITDEIKKNDVKILALSGVLTLALNSMKKTIEALKAAGLRDSVKVIIGGAPVTENNCKLVGADAWSLNPQEGIRICREWAGI
jgi:methylmalonyl-CoA mutase cobalamin-binding domain/chain